MREKDEGERLRRLAAVMRFLGHIRESIDEAQLVDSLIQAAAVWYDLDARSYRRQLNGRYVLDAWLPGADVSHDPRELDPALLSADAPSHISSISELEQLGWRSLQGEVLLLPVVAGGQVRRLLVVPGTVERDIESMLMLVCRSAGSVLDQIGARRRRELQDRLTKKVASVRGTFQTCMRAVIEEYLAIVGPASARVVVRPADHKPLTLMATGDGWATEPVPGLRAGAAEIAMERIALAYGLANESTAIIELLAPPDRPFTFDHAQAARAGGEALSVWLSGISIGASQKSDRPAAPVPAAPAFEEKMHAELSRAGRLSLSGGVLLASVPAARGVPDPRVMAIVIRAVRAELRSSDLLGQLADGDIAAVLVRTSADGVASAALRVRQRLDTLARSRQLPPVVVGHALYPTGVTESPLALVARARREAGLTFS